MTHDQVRQWQQRFLSNIGDAQVYWEAWQEFKEAFPPTEPGYQEVAEAYENHKPPQVQTWEYVASLS